MGAPAAGSVTLAHERHRRVRLSAWDWLFVAALTVVFVVRYVIATQSGAPATTDAGNWLAFSDSIFGADYRSGEIVYPPVVPLVTRGAVAVLGVVNGVGFLTALCSLVPAIAVYATLRAARLEGVAAFGPAVLIAGATSTSEAAAWGGFPQLISFGLLIAFLTLLDRFLTRCRLSDALWAGALLAALVGTSHFTLSVAVGAAACLLLMDRRPIAEKWHRILALSPLVAVPSLIFLPTYLTLVHSAFGVSTSFRELNQLSWESLIPNVEFLYRDLPWLWRPIVVLALVAPLILVRRRGSLWRVSSAITLSAVALIVALGEPRYLYVLPVVGVIALGALLQGIDLEGEARRHLRTARLTRFAPATLVIAAFIQVVTGVFFFREQHQFYAIVTPGVFQAINYVADAGEDLGVVALPSLNDAPLGWWFEALVKRPTVYGAPLRWLTFADELERAEIANEIFAPGFPTHSRYELALSAGVRTLFVPKRWGFYDAARVPSDESPAVVFENAEVVVLDVATALSTAGQTRSGQ